MILRWYKDTQEGKAKGKTVFLEQMKAFIDWLKNAEEEGEHWLQMAGGTGPGRAGMSRRVSTVPSCSLFHKAIYIPVVGVVCRFLKD